MTIPYYEIHSTVIPSCVFLTCIALLTTLALFTVYEPWIRLLLSIKRSSPYAKIHKQTNTLLSSVISWTVSVTPATHVKLTRASLEVRNQEDTCFFVDDKRTYLIRSQTRQFLRLSHRTKSQFCRPFPCHWPEEAPWGGGETRGRLPLWLLAAPPASDFPLPGGMKGREDWLDPTGKPTVF